MTTLIRTFNFRQARKEHDYKSITVWSICPNCGLKSVWSGSFYYGWWSRTLKGQECECNNCHSRYYLNYLKGTARKVR